MIGKTKLWSVLAVSLVGVAVASGARAQEGAPPAAGSGRPWWAAASGISESTDSWSSREI